MMPPAVPIFMLFLLATLPLAQAGAQAEKRFAGTWTIQTDEAHGTTDDGGHWNLDATTSTLTLTQTGTTLAGTWSGQGQPWPLTGRVEGDTFECEIETRELPVVRNGEKGTIRSRWVFRGTLTLGKRS
jgi:hypothetical protein